jgi:hypothetical protein
MMVLAERRAILTPSFQGPRSGKLRRQGELSPMESGCEATNSRPMRLYAIGVARRDIAA